MSQELEAVLRDLFLGTFLDDGEEVRGMHFTTFNDGAVLMSFHTLKPDPGKSEIWHTLLIPATNIQMVQDRLSSVPGTISPLSIVDAEPRRS
ncbi:MAG: hypothetical protein J2P36_04990 [Ktedonobacteraceae bacterium]|nr:hypothetical protein [Ktedonobacteraceae bacterium]